MKRVLLLAGLALLLGPAIVARTATEASLRFRRFGAVDLYRAARYPSRVIVFMSGEGRRSRGAAETARALASMDALVAAVDADGYLTALGASRRECLSLAGDVEALSQFVQKTLDLPHYAPPVLVGDGLGAALAYATLAQAPAGTFLGGVGLGPRPDLPTTKPPCPPRGLGANPDPAGTGHALRAAAGLERPWIDLEGTTAGDWTPRVLGALTRLAGTREAALSPVADGLTDLPLVEVPAIGPAGDILAVILSGDGGWAGIDRELAGVLARRGIPVAGFNSLQYFWTPRTPDGAARDLERVLRHYLAAWRKERAVLIGYSLGADVLPFMASRLSAGARARVAAVALLGPAHGVDFEFHLTDWLRSAPRKSAYPVLPEVQRLRGTTVLCVYGEDEKDTICPSLDAGQATVVRLTGGHHFGGDYATIAETVLRAAH